MNILGKSALVAMVVGLYDCMKKLPQSRHLVDKPEKRRAYLEQMLKMLCTDIGPKPAGSQEFQKAALVIKQEMEKALPFVEMDYFNIDKWELKSGPQFIIEDKSLETYAAVGGPSTPEQGLTGILRKVEDEKKPYQYKLIEARDGKALAYIVKSGWGRAIPRHYNSAKFDSLPVFNIGKQDMPLLDKAVEKNKPVKASVLVEIIKGVRDCNIVGTLPGKSVDEILFLAHADTHYNTQGANDNTASMIALLLLAHAISGEQPNKTVTFVSTGAEEIGCLGAEHYKKKREEAGTLKNIKYCVNFDSLTYGPNLQVYSTDQKLRKMVVDIDRDLNVPGTPKEFNEDDQIDGAPFVKAGIPTLYLNSRGYNEKTLPLWHRPEDRPENVHLELIENSFIVFEEFIKRLQVV
jgi:hypothetical protein